VRKRLSRSLDGVPVENLVHSLQLLPRRVDPDDEQVDVRFGVRVTPSARTEEEHAAEAGAV